MTLAREHVTYKTSVQPVNKFVVDLTSALVSVQDIIKLKVFYTVCNMS